MKALLYKEFKLAMHPICYLFVIFFPLMVLIPGLSLNGYVSILAIAIIGFGIADVIFFLNYYKNGRSILLPTLMTIFGFILYLAVFSIIIPYIPGCEWYKDILCNRGIGIQFAFLGGALVISFLLHLLTYKVSSKRLEKVDF